MDNGVSSFVGILGELPGEAIPASLVVHGLSGGDPARALEVQRELNDMAVRGVIDADGDLMSVSAAVPRPTARDISQAIEVLARVFPEDADEFGTWGVCESLLAVTRFAIQDGRGGKRLESTRLTLASRVGAYLRSTDQLQDAVALCESSLERSGHATQDRAASLYRELAWSLNDLGDASGAREALDRSFVLRDPDEARELGLDRLALSQVLGSSEQYDSALEHGVSAAATLPSDAIRERGHTLLAVGWARLGMGAVDQGIADLESGVALLAQALGEEHPEVASATATLGVARFREERGAEHAGRMVDEALDRLRSSVGPQHSSYGMAVSCAAEIAGGNGELDRSVTLFEEAAKVAEGAYPPGHNVTFYRLRQLWMAAEQSGDHLLGRRARDGALAIADVQPSWARGAVAGFLADIAKAEGDTGDRNAEAALLGRAAFVGETAEREEGAIAGRFYRWKAGEAFESRGDIDGMLSAYRGALVANQRSETPSLSLESAVRQRLTALITSLTSQIRSAAEALDEAELAERAEQIGRDINLGSALRTIDTATIHSALSASGMALNANDRMVARQAVELAADLARTASGGSEAPGDTRFAIAAGWFQIGRESAAVSDDSAAAEAFTRALRGIRAAEGDEERRLGEEITVLLSAASASARDGNAEVAMALLSEADDLSRAADIDTQITTQYQLGLQIEGIAGLGSAVPHLERTIELFRENENHNSKHVVVQVLGAVLRLRQVNDQFVSNLRYLCARAGETEERASALLWLGRALEGAEEFDAALSTYSERIALLSALQTDDHQQVGVTHHDIGDVYTRLGRLKRAADHYLEAVRHKRQSPNRHDFAESLISLARVLSADCRFGEALRATDELMAVVTESEGMSPARRAASYETHGDVLLALSRPDAALGVMQDAVALRESVGRTAELLEANLSLANAALLANDLEIAAATLSRANELALALDGAPPDLVPSLRVFGALSRPVDRGHFRDQILEGLSFSSTTEDPTQVLVHLRDFAAAHGEPEISREAEALLRLGVPDGQGNAGTTDLSLSGRETALFGTTADLNPRAAADTWLAFGRLCLDEGDFGRAVRGFRRCSRVFEAADQTTSASLTLAKLGEAQASAAQGDISGAEVKYRDLLAAITPNSSSRTVGASARLGFGRVLAALGRLDDADTAFREVVEDPNATADSRGVALHDRAVLMRFRRAAPEAVWAVIHEAVSLERAGRAPIRMAPTLSLAADVRFDTDPAEAVSLLADFSAVVFPENAALDPWDTFLPDGAGPPEGPAAEGESVFRVLPFAPVSRAVRRGVVSDRSPDRDTVELGLVAADSSGWSTTTEGMNVLERAWAEPYPSGAVPDGVIVQFAEVQKSLMKGDEDGARAACAEVSGSDEERSALAFRGLRYVSRMLRYPAVGNERDFPVRIFDPETHQWSISDGRSHLAIALPLLAREDLETAIEVGRRSAAISDGISGEVGLYSFWAGARYEAGGDSERAADAYTLASEQFALVSERLRRLPSRVAGDLGVHGVGKPQDASTLFRFDTRPSSDRELAAGFYLRALRTFTLAQRPALAFGAGMLAMIHVRRLSGGEFGVETDPVVGVAGGRRDLTPQARFTLWRLAQNQAVCQARGITPGIAMSAHPDPSRLYAGVSELEQAGLATMTWAPDWVELTLAGRDLANGSDDRGW